MSMSHGEVKKGLKYKVNHSGVVTTTDEPRYIPGGWVVDVESPSPFPGEPPLRWTACLCNFDGAADDPTLLVNILRDEV